MKWKFNEDDDESAQKGDFLYQTSAIVETNKYLYQLISSEDKKKVRNTYGLNERNDAHTITFTYWTGKCNDETQVT